ncbi:MAG: response regulator, partial [Pseudomonadota bacterium]
MSVQSDGDMTILVIDDHPLVRDALCANLAAAGYMGEHVLKADSLTQALSIIRGTSPDLVLLDLELGDSSGLEGL